MRSRLPLPTPVVGSVAFGYGPELEHIGAHTAGQLVDVQTADEDIVAVVTEDTVATAAARDPVVAGAAEETVVAIRA